jgi:hypothetical protein
VAGHKDSSVSKGNGDKEGMSSERPWVLTKGKILTAPVIFTNGIPGDPPAPKMRGDAKPMGSWQAPVAAKNPSNSGPYQAFGIRSAQQEGKGGKRGMSR